MKYLPVVAVVLAVAAPARADESLAKVSAEVNEKLVKLFGSGGFRGLVSYGTGVVISEDGYILTVASHILDTQDLRVHLADGRRLHGKLVATEPQLDVALVKVDKVQNLPHFDIRAAAARPVAHPGTAILGFSNAFQIATRDEPMSVQRGLIAAYGKLHGRRGIFEAAFAGDVYILDAVTNNPGAAGGVITNRKGELLGLIGKELRNALTETWVNYAVPIQARIDSKREEQAASVSIAEFVEQAMAGKYVQLNPRKKSDGPRGYHGIVLIFDVVERTPPYVEDVMPGSPADKAGIRPDDLIVYVDGEQVGSIKAFRELVDGAPPGAKVRLEVRRGDKLQTVDLTLADNPTRKKP